MSNIAEEIFYKWYQPGNYTLVINEITKVFNMKSVDIFFDCIIQRIYY